MADPLITLAQHEDNSVAREAAILSKLDELKGNTMDSTIPPVANFFANPGAGTGAAIGGGLGAGVLGGLLGGMLLNNGGLVGNRGVVGDGVVTPTLLAAELNRVQDNQNASIAASERLTQTRFDAEAQREIQAAIERTAAATQLANAVQSAALGVEMAKGQGDTNTQVALTTGNLGTQNALNAAAIQTQAAKQAGDLSTQIALNTANVATAVERTGTASALAFKDSALLAQANTTLLSNQLAATQYTLATAVKSDGDLTRALIIAQNDATLNRLLVTAQNEIIELRGDREGNRRSRETEINVNQTVTQVQAQAQAQQQQQQQLLVLNNIANCLAGLQNAVATNSNLIIGNTGAVATGAQTANPVNVRA